jgi:glycosyltransferase involved in cell wall biosynthesis
MTTPLVSICIPAYNNRDVIEKAIDSILNQTYTNIELARE